MLGLASGIMHATWGPTVANISMAVASAAIDTIAVMFSVLTMQPEMPHFQWLLVTLTAGVGVTLERVAWRVERGGASPSSG